MATPILPRAQSPIAGREYPAPVWYDFFRSLLQFVSDNEGDIGQIQSILARLAALESADDQNALILGLSSVQVFGSLSDGLVQIQLEGDTDAPGNTYYYGTTADGTKGWFAVESALAVESGELTKTVDADGVTTFGLADVPNLGDGAFLLFYRDAKGRVVSTTPGDSDDVPEGATNLYFTDGRAQSAVVTASITNGDTTHSPSGDAVFDALAGLSGTYQPLDATLTALAGQNWVDNALPIGSGADTVSQVAFAANTFPARASAGGLAAKTVTDGALSALAGSGGAAGFLRGDGVVANNVSGDFGIGTDTPNYAGFARAITVESTTNTAYEMASTRADADNVLIGAFTANFRTASPGHQRIADVQFTTEGSVANQRGGRLGFYTKGDGSTALSRKWSVRQNGHFTPEVDNTYDIGAPAARAAAVYTFNLIRSGALFDSGAVSPAQLTANTDNWSIAGLSTAAIIRASTNASRNVTGIASPTPWQSLLLVNIGAFDLVLVHDATSTAANRFLCPGSANLTLNPNDSVRLWYDNTSSRWRVIGV